MAAIIPEFTIFLIFPIIYNKILHTKNSCFALSPFWTNINEFENSEIVDYAFDFFIEIVTLNITGNIDLTARGLP